MVQVRMSEHGCLGSSCLDSYCALIARLPIFLCFGECRAARAPTPAPARRKPEPCQGRSTVTTKQDELLQRVKQESVNLALYDGYHHRWHLACDGCLFHH